MQGFTAIPNAVLRDTTLSVRARVLYGIILSYAWGASGCQCTPERLAHECSISRNTFFDCVKQLKEAGLLKADRKRVGRVWETVYIPLARGVSMYAEQQDLGVPEVGSPNRRTPPNGTAHARGHVTTEEDSTLSLTGESVSSSVKYRGKKVPPPIVENATRLLGVYNEVTERSLGARKADGTPSSNLTQILGALLDRPEVTVAEWETGIRRIAAYPPEWVNGSGLQIGHVFGERGANWTLDPKVAAPRNGNGHGTNQGDLVRSLLRAGGEL